MLEWQRDWARKETYDAVTGIAKEHSGAYGMGIDYAVTHVHKLAERVTHGERIGLTRPRPVSRPPGWRWRRHRQPGATLFRTPQAAR